MADSLNFFQQGLWLAVILAAPPLIVATLLGVAVSIVQAITQIQDQTLPYAVKLIGISLSLAMTGRWIGGEIVQLTNLALSMITSVGR